MHTYKKNFVKGCTSIDIRNPKPFVEWSKQNYLKPLPKEWVESRKLSTNPQAGARQAKLQMKFRYGEYCRMTAKKDRLKFRKWLKANVVEIQPEEIAA